MLFFRNTGARLLFLVGILLAGLSFAPSRMAAQNQLNVLVSLPAPQGSSPYSQVTIGSDGNFYITAIYGGASGFGTVCRITPAGAIKVLHSFTGGSDGAYPWSSVVQDTDGNYYGVTSGFGQGPFGPQAGTSGFGTIYRITPAGAYSVLYTFTGGADGAFPIGQIATGPNGILYGTCESGSAGGTVWSYNPASNQFSVLYTFTNGQDGEGCWAGPLVEPGPTLYVASAYGGPSNAGAILQIVPGVSATVLHTFDGADGSDVVGTLTLGSDGLLYGTAAQGGANFGGALFRISTGGQFTKLHDFTFGSDGGTPAGALVEANGVFYGTAFGGGATGRGVVYTYTPASSTFQTLAAADGIHIYNPWGGLTLSSNGFLYGTSNRGATAAGDLYQVSTSGSVSVVSALASPDGAFLVNGLMQGTDGNFYGMADDGGLHGFGTLYKLTSAGKLTVLHPFDETDGAFPRTAPFQGVDGNLYGAAILGGLANAGVAFEATTKGGFNLLHSFGNSTGDGQEPDSVLIQGFDGAFYGTTFSGGASGAGSVYRIGTDGTESVLYSFTGGVDGDHPGTDLGGNLVAASDGNYYGTTLSGGSAGQGALFKLTPVGALTTIHNFSSSDGTGVFSPSGYLIQGADGALYGSSNGNAGSVYRCGLDGSFSALHVFNGADGAGTFGGVIQGTDGNFYGATGFGGANGFGTLFQVTPTGTFTTLWPFHYVDGFAPIAPLLEGTDGNLYGTTDTGGMSDLGVIFRYNAALPGVFISKFSPTSVLAGGKAFTLTVDGAGFVSGDTVEWNNNPVSTTFVSASQIKAGIPAAAIANPGVAYVRVVTSTNGLTGSRLFPLIVTAVKVKKAALTRNGDGSVTAVVTLANSGFYTAQNTDVLTATLNGVATSTSLPANVGAIPAGGTATTTLTFPNPGASGAGVKLNIAGSFTGGTFKGTLTVTLP